MLLFHGIIFLMACGSFSAFVMYNLQAYEICSILNCLLLRPNGLSKALLHYRYKWSNILVSLFVFMTPLLFLVLVVFVLTITLICPCLHENRFYTFLLGPCNAYKFRTDISCRNYIHDSNWFCFVITCHLCCCNLDGNYR